MEMIWGAGCAFMADVQANGKVCRAGYLLPMRFQAALGCGTRWSFPCLWECVCANMAFSGSLKPCFSVSGCLCVYWCAKAIRRSSIAILIYYNRAFSPVCLPCRICPIILPISVSSFPEPAIPPISARPRVP